jgi:hypothetical protein
MLNDKIANIYTSNNNFSGSNSYALIPSLLTDLTSSVTNDLQLTNKKYVDNTVYGLYTRDNTFSGNNVFNLDSGHNLTSNKMTVTNSFVAANNSFTIKHCLKLIRL